MIELRRSKDHKWIMQKNISSKDIIQAYLGCIKNSSVDYESVKNQLRDEGVYYGRSAEGSKNTMGVRFSQMCFYMFGYKTRDKYFIPSPMTHNIFKENCKILPENNSLVTLFSMQFPNPYSNTPQEFQIHIGRLLVKLLLDNAIDKKLYIDEIIWFLPFLEKIDPSTYQDLTQSILEYRQLSYSKKLELFRRSCYDYNDLYANVTHEFNYYFLRIFEGFGVIEYHADPYHNQGNIFSFRHGNGNTFRNDSYKSRSKTPGYITLTDKVKPSAKLLNSQFSAFDKPTSMQSELILSHEDWLNTIYNLEPIQYLACISHNFQRLQDVSDVISKMIYASKYGSRDGKEFENSLLPIIELFKETRNVEILSGAGNTDLLCAMDDRDIPGRIYKMNVDAKTRKKALEEINSRRLETHIARVGAEFCIVVAPKFASGVSLDIQGKKIVTLRAEELGTYCYKECSSSTDGYADFQSIYNIIRRNQGSDITVRVQQLIERKFGIELPG